MQLDLYLLITQGQYSPDRSNYWTPDGYYIIVDEEIVNIPRKGGSSQGSGYSDFIIRKRITITVKKDNQNIKKSFLLKNVNLKVNNIEILTKQNIIKVELHDIRFDNIIKTINIDID